MLITAAVSELVGVQIASLMRGNVVDLAVGVIIGLAFGAIVNSLVNDIIMPVIGAITGGLDFSNYYLPILEGSARRRIC